MGGGLNDWILFVFLKKTQSIHLISDTFVL